MASSNKVVELSTDRRGTGYHKAALEPCCKLCGSNLVEPLYHKEAGAEFAQRLPAGSSIPSTGQTVVRCLACGLGFAFSPSLGSDPTSDELYGDEYYTSQMLSGRMDDWISRKQMPPSQREFDFCVRQDEQLLQYLQGVLTRVRIPNSSNEPIRYLDVGCGCCESLWAGRKLGWSVVGTDIAKPAIQFGRSVLGLDIREGLLAELDFPESSFDIVTLREVLEHSPEPSELLRDIHRLLSPSGVLYLQVPNDLEGCRARIFSKAWHLIPPVHLQYFTLPSLTTLLAMNGFAISSSGTSGGIGREVLRYAWWRLGLLGVVDKTYYRPYLGLAVKAMSRTMFELMRPLDRYFEGRGMGTTLWVCVRKL